MTASRRHFAISKSAITVALIVVIVAGLGAFAGTYYAPRYTVTVAIPTTTVSVVYATATSYVATTPAISADGFATWISPECSGTCYSVQITNLAYFPISTGVFNLTFTDLTSDRSASSSCTTTYSIDSGNSAYCSGAISPKFSSNDMIMLKIVAPNGATATTATGIKSLYESVTSLMLYSGSAALESSNSQCSGTHLAIGFSPGVGNVTISSISGFSSSSSVGMFFTNATNCQILSNFGLPETPPAGGQPSPIIYLGVTTEASVKYSFSVFLSDGENFSLSAIAQ